ncbi:MAG: DNA polymerase III subunit gamma/tau [Thiotrichales bacterium]|nr:DNA polymerase III subunit gamma/tau [Thiotrichales bacterium]
MSYTVLARKWRPKNFSELVGQQHVMQALSNALDQQRLHHAYLFTGTRGVGKTTIARIFAKALNCEQGITSTPCGQCPTCRSIDEGRFVDLIEVDAASKTKVEDTRELLENVQYAPVQGRFKVYLIDEVHMLSKSSFNALLKTLEEPPEHVKFLLATTDPHKLPITVLSRCLQFNLMRLTPTQIQNHLAYILQQEQVPFEESALSMIAKSADGSARDSLSILDQAIAYGGGQVMFEPVQAMLGLVDQQFVLKILTALLNQSPDEVKAVMVELSRMGVDYEALNHQLIEVFHQLSLIQVLGGLNDLALVDEAFLHQVAQTLSPEKVQMLYQVALLAQQDMRLAPDVRIGFEMALLRMLAFEPQTSSGQTSSSVQSNGTKVEVPVTVQQSASAQPQSTVAEAPVMSQVRSSEQSQSEPASIAATVQVAETQLPMSTPVDAAEQDDKDVQHLMSLKEKISQSLGKLRTKPSAQEVETTPNTEGNLSEPVAPVESADNAISTGFVAPASSESTGTQLQPEAMPPVEAMPSVQAPESFSSESFIPEEMPEVPMEAYNDDFSRMDMDVDEVGVDLSVMNSPQSPINEVVEPPLVQSNTPHVSESISTASVHQENQLETTSDSFADFEANGVEDWVRLVQAMNLDGWAGELVNQSMMVSHDQQGLVLSVDPQHASAKSELALSKLEEVVREKLGCALTFIEAEGEHLTPAKYWQHQKALQQQDAVQSIYQDPNVQGFMEILNMRVIDSSIQSLGDGR